MEAEAEVSEEVNNSHRVKFKQFSNFYLLYIIGFGGGFGGGSGGGGGFGGGLYINPIHNYIGNNNFPQNYVC